MKPRYINTLNLNSLFVLKRRTMTQHNTLYTCIFLSFRNHMAINPNFLVALVHVILLDW